MVSRFLEDFTEYIKENGGKVFTVAEIRGNELPEKIEVKENNASQIVYSISKMYTVTAIGILWDRGLLKLDDTVVDILGDECPDGYEPCWESTTIDMLMRHMIGFPGGPDLTRYAAEYNVQ